MLVECWLLFVDCCLHSLNNNVSSSTPLEIDIKSICPFAKGIILWHIFCRHIRPYFAWSFSWITGNRQLQMEKDDKGSTMIRMGVSVGECSFWCRPTRVVPDQRPLNGRCCSWIIPLGFCGCMLNIPPVEVYIDRVCRL